MTNNNTFDHLVELYEEFQRCLHNLECHMNKLEFDRMVEEFEDRAQH